MKKLQNIFKIVVLTIIVSLFVVDTSGQNLEIDSATRIVMSGSDELFPSWSPTGNEIVFQSNKNGSFNLFIYDLQLDTIRQITSGKANKQHPVYMPKSNKIAFDSQIDDKAYIFKIDRATGRQDVIFKRKLFCKEPSFSPSERLMTFTGYDQSSETWQIFSYDFIYDNLNQLTHYKHKEVFNPKFSPDGKIIIFGTKDKFSPYWQSLEEMNWYGNAIKSIDTLQIQSYCWSYNSFRIICSVKKTASSSKIISMRKDGSAVSTLLDESFQLTNPAFSPDGRKFAVSIKSDDDFDIYIFTTEEQ